MESCTGGVGRALARVPDRRRWLDGLIALAWGACLAAPPLHGDVEDPPLPAGVEASELEPPRVTVGPLTQAAVQESFRLLRQRYLYRGDLDLERLNRLSLEGVLEGLGPGAGLVTEADAAGAGQPWPLAMAELVGGAVYLRPGSTADDDLEPAREQLRAWDGRRPWLVVDLRGRIASEGTEPERALAWLELFVGPNEILFKRTHPEGGRPWLFVTAEPPVWSGRVIALIDADTGMAGELVAAVLEQRGAILVGSATGGRTVDYEEVAVADGVRLRFATSELLLADDRSLFGRGLQPQWVIEEAPEAKRKRLAADGEVVDWFMERPRPRMNERSLVEGGQPELDWRLARAAGEESEWDQAPNHDPVLRAVLDALVAARAMAGE